MTATTSSTQQPEPARRPRGGGRRWGDIAIASLLSATLATGGTYAVVRAGDGDSEEAAAPAVSARPVEDAGNGVGEGTPVALDEAVEWSGVADEVTPSVVSIDVAGQTGVGAGSGVVWDDQGHIVTNAHVVEGGQLLRVTLHDGRGYSAQVVGTDTSSDLAVLRLDTIPDGLSPITVGDDSQLVVGEPVMAVGNPLGLSGTVTTGIVSALDRPVTTLDSSGPRASAVVTNAIQTSAAINPGNSGGALVNGAGQLVGINSSIASIPTAGQSQAGSIGIGFAIPTTKVRLIADQLIETGTAEHAFLGVGLNDGQAEADGAILSGARVERVEPGSPADGASLQTDDVIVGIDGEPVSSATAVIGQIRERASGQEATIEYVRDGELAEVTVTLATRPDQLR